MSSFESTLARIDRSIMRQTRTLEDLKRQRALIAPRVSEMAMAALDRKLRLHCERVEQALEAARLEREAVAELVAKSPELPMEDPGKPKKR